MKQATGAVAGARDRMDANLDPVFTAQILEPIFEFNCRHYFGPLIAAHRAWITMLMERGIVDPGKTARTLAGLARLEAAGVAAIRPFDPAAEYFYLHVEKALTSLVPGGESIVGDLNLGRTRPEPLSRMVLRDALLRILNLTLDLRDLLLTRSDAEAETVMPGYTHLLHAQPTTLAHYLLAIHDHLERDTERLFGALKVTDCCTLGCGAMSGSSLPIDRERVRELLGFGALCENTLDSVAAEDHVTASAAAMASVMTIIGRLCQDLYIWSSQEFALIDITDAFSSPSSLMPQKKNALVLEYLRARTARTIAAASGCFGVLHNVGYMDTEEVEFECYQPLFEAYTLTEQALPTIARVVSVMRPDRTLMRARAEWGFSAVTALAETIHIAERMSYRSAHRVVARAVLLASRAGKNGSDFDLALLNRAAMEIMGRSLALDQSAVTTSLNSGMFVQRHAGTGAPAPGEVRRMVHDRLPRAAADRARVKEKELAISAADAKLRELAATIVASRNSEAL